MDRPAAERRIIASGVFAGGSAPLLPGARYVLAIRADDLQVMGPVDTQPDRIVLSRRLDELESSALKDRLIVVGTSARLRDFSLVFSGIGGRTAQEVDHELDAQRMGRTAPVPG